MGEKSGLSRYFFVTLSVLLVSILATSQLLHAQEESKFRFPLNDSQVVRGFEKPLSPFGAGHRGVDFNAPSGSKVYAIGDGQVVFAGLVAGSLHVTLDHGSDVKSTYTFLSVKSVEVGQIIKRGQLIGYTSGNDPTGAKNTFHFSIRVAGEYVDPIAFIKNNLLHRDIRLAPIEPENESLWKHIGNIEANFIKELLGASKNLASRTFDVVSSQVGFMYNFQVKSFEQLQDFIHFGYQAVIEVNNLILKAKEIAERITIEIAQGSLDVAKRLRQQFTELQIEIIKLSKKAFNYLIQATDIFLEGFNQALKRGISAAKHYLEILKEAYLLPLQLSFAMVRGLADFANSVVVMTGKTFNQYLEIDVPLLLRQIVNPGYCAFNKCVSPIKLKCDPLKKFRIRTKEHGYEGSGNAVIALSGIRSSGEADPETGKISDTSSIPLKTLGYQEKDINYYSYKGVGQSFNSLDPYQDLEISAKVLDDQVKDFKKRNPNKALDLMSHSLGGAVISAWLAIHYDPEDKSYPAIGKVILFAPPISGTASATSGMKAFESKGFSHLWDTVFEPSDMPKSDTEVLESIKESGKLDELVRKNEIGKKADIYIIRNSTDFVVSAASKPVKDTTEIVLDDFPPNNWIYNSHTKITTDSKSVSTAQSILQNETVPCESIGAAVRNITNSSLVHAITISFGENVGVLGQHADNQSENLKRFSEAVAG